MIRQAARLNVVQALGPYTSITALEKDNKAITRLAPIATKMFEAIKKTPGSQGILFGGGAAAFLGHKRGTMDLDINVTKFPSEDVYGPNVKDRQGSGPLMRKVTFFADDKDNTVACDVSTSKADLVREIIKDHTVTIPDLEGVVVAGYVLLLADKINTYCSRSEQAAAKKAHDIQDIAFCMEHMFSFGLKMDPRLRKLYTDDQWLIVRAHLAETDEGRVLLENKKADDGIGILKTPAQLESEAQVQKSE